MKGPLATQLRLYPLTPQPRRLRLLTQNVWCHYPMSLVKQCAHAMSGSDFTGRLQLLTQHIISEQYDVVCLQELFVTQIWPFGIGPANFDLLRQLLAEGGLVHHTDPCESIRAGRWIGQNSGVVIFSRFPLSDVQSVDFERTSERMNTKGFVMARLQLPADPPLPQLVVVSVHLDARDWDSKAAQIQQVAEHVAQHRGDSSSPVAIVLCGDWNVCPQLAGHGGYDDGSQYAYLTSQLHQHLRVSVAWKPEESEVTEGNATLDHIFLDDKLGWRLVDKSVVRVVDSRGLSVSDHFGLALTIEELLSGDAANGENC